MLLNDTSPEFWERNFRRPSLYPAPIGLNTTYYGIRVVEGSGAGKADADFLRCHIETATISVLFFNATQRRRDQPTSQSSSSSYSRSMSGIYENYPYTLGGTALQWYAHSIGAILVCSGNRTTSASFSKSSCLVRVINNCSRLTFQYFSLIFPGRSYFYCSTLRKFSYTEALRIK